MSQTQHHDSFAGDTEFRKLLARQPKVDVIDAALELARDADPKLDFGPTRQWIGDRADELPAVGRSDVALLRELSQSLSARHGLRGDADSYRSAESSYLNRVIETGRGIPITLSLLYTAVGERLGLHVYGVGAPSHFLVACETGGERVFVDPFSGGRVLDETQALRWLREMTGLPGERIRDTLRPASPREIIVRMLHNLKRLHVEQECWRALFAVQRRLAALHPGSYSERRDLAVSAQRAGQLSIAINLFAGCLSVCPRDEKPTLQRLLQETQAKIAAWN
jgi:regulator of sirC expression with transglutaminase-like and TPR domain